MRAVNNVGTNIRKPSTEFSASDYSTIFTTNLESAFSLSQLFHPLLKAAGSSVLLFNSSVAGAGC
jgi:Tropinone reductase 1